MTVRAPQKTASDPNRIIIDAHRGTYGSFGYRSVRVASGEGRSYVSYPGSTHDDLDRPRLIAQSRDFRRNNAIYQGMIDRAVDYIVGGGFIPQVTGVPVKTAEKLESLWGNWYSHPEIRGLLSGPNVSQMTMREILVAGDTLALKTDKGLIQMFEAEQLDGDSSHPNGIRKDKYGRPVTFHLCPWKSHGIDKRDGRGVPAKDVVFISNPERPSQIRGVPACQAIFPMLHRINDVCDSEAIAWQLLARLAISVTREQGPELAYTESREDPNKTSNELAGDMATRMTELNYALIFHGKPGDEVKGIERNIPGMNFSDSLRTFLRILGLALGMPLELLLLDWTKSNYSQSRAVLEQAYRTFNRWQQKLRDFHYQPLFDWKLETWRNELTIGQKNQLQVQWIAPEYPWLDQLKEAQAHAMKVERGFSTHSQVCKSLGTDRDEIIIQREREVRDAIETAQRIEKETGQKVPYEIFCGLKVETPKTQPAEQVETDEKQGDDDA